ncbi:hypothetical protein E2C01_072615 [Portunus trituberculatus]|uniref:Uncharacterized protein n=1 Tax=Portunus trituberculatus TaxID=210409 RepID=A0A5B7I7N7_PORTR|nr:hypothetical protein [Portunus trituberculatus]
MTYREVSGSYLFFNLFSTMARFHIHSGYYLVILYSCRNLCDGSE